MQRYSRTFQRSETNAKRKKILVERFVVFIECEQKKECNTQKYLFQAKAIH